MAKRILIIMGTRPEVIKLAPVYHALTDRHNLAETSVCFTGQHHEMLYQAAEYFELTPDFDLKVMKKGQTLFSLTASLISNLESVLEAAHPDLILVQGDTTTAFAAALAGYYKQIQIGHVEAGLRTSNRFAPYPEEMNRRLVGALADHHFAPTKHAKAALLKEGVHKTSIIVTGNTVIDALFYILHKVENKPPSIAGLDDIFADNRRIVLITGHRRENFGEGFRNICEAIRHLALTHKDVVFVYPVHLNPNVQKSVYPILSELPNVYLMPPLGYLHFVYLISKAHIILTDSGGIQEEAPSLGKPVLVMRETTEREDAVEAGAAILVGTDKEKIIGEAGRLLTDRDAWEGMSRIQNLFGDGKASRRIVDYIEKKT